MSPSQIAPFSEPLIGQLNLPLNSPFNNPKVNHLRKFVREWVEKHLVENAQHWEQVTGKVPDSVFREYCKAGFAVTHPITDPEDAGGVALPAGIPYQEWDTYCSVITTDELSRLGFTGVNWALGSGSGIGTPIITKFGSQEQRRRWLPRVAKGEIRFCLGITEPEGGSDVANIRTTARLNTAGDAYIVNGSKKWITNGIFADYCTAAVRTSKQGRHGISVLVIPLKNVPGVKCRPMQNQGVGASGSTFLTFEDAMVPRSNLIGKEGDGFGMIMSNFNPERLALATAALRLARVCVEDSYNYACHRETFGKKLIEHPAIQSKIAKFGLLIEPAQAFLEQLCVIIETAKTNLQVEVNVGGMTALLKVLSTRALEKVCREAQQIMGGAGYARSGHGARIEQISRDVRVHAVGGGSEEIMLDLAVREESKAVRRRSTARSRL